MTTQVTVKYKYGRSRPDTTSTWNGTVQGRSESAVLAELQKRHPGSQILIIDIRWR